MLFATVIVLSLAHSALTLHRRMMLAFPTYVTATAHTRQLAHRVHVVMNQFLDASEAGAAAAESDAEESEEEESDSESEESEEDKTDALAASGSAWFSGWWGSSKTE